MNRARIKQAYKIIKDVLRSFHQRRQWKHLVIHRRTLTKLPSAFILPLISGHVKGKLKCPSEITIVLIHNYPFASITEKSLQYVGINNYVVLKPEVSGEWRNALKLSELKKYLDSGECQSKYILYLDSDDVVIRDSPEKAIQYLEQQDCDLLFSSTPYNGGYECMPQALEWSDRLSAEAGFGKLYINCGVFFGKTEAVKELFDASVEYVTENDLTRAEYYKHLKEQTMCKSLSEFPKEVGCDQIIIRHLHPEFYPRMKIDFKEQLALR